MSTPTDLEYWMRRCGALVKENSDLGAEVSRLRVELERPPKEAETWRAEVREELVKDWENEWKAKFEVLQKDRERLQGRLDLALKALEAVEWEPASDSDGDYLRCVYRQCGRSHDPEWPTHERDCILGKALGRDVL